ncbi:hypothetical protein B0H11DRAFT_2280266 [Mycena galericulata]|nr:hypothetical protein B0H11DRAFT_2280266 [Mycena galericulata]
MFRVQPWHQFQSHQCHSTRIRLPPLGRAARRSSLLELPLQFPSQPPQLSSPSGPVQSLTKHWCSHLYSRRQTVLRPNCWPSSDVCLSAWVHPSATSATSRWRRWSSRWRRWWRRWRRWRRRRWWWWWRRRRRRRRRRRWWASSSSASMCRRRPSSSILATSSLSSSAPALTSSTTSSTVTPPPITTPQPTVTPPPPPPSENGVTQIPTENGITPIDPSPTAPPPPPLVTTTAPAEPPQRPPPCDDSSLDKRWRFWWHKARHECP